jgi:cysteine desulfurase family protein
MNDVASGDGVNKNYYFDNAATSWPKPENVYKAADNQMRNMFGNPGRSGHTRTLEADRLIYKTRAAIGRFFNIDDPARIAFTLNATDALNMALKGYLKQGDLVLHTAMDHNSVLRPLSRLSKENFITMTTIPCSEEGYPSLDFLESALKRKSSLLVINHASNVTGTIAPLHEMVNLAHSYGAAVLVDAAQTAGSIPIDAGTLGIDMLAFTGHKGLLGPTGTGGLYIRPGLEIKSMREGGTGSQSELDTHPEDMPERLEAGTLNSAGLAGLFEGVTYIMETGLDKIRKHEQNLRFYLCNKLAEFPGIKLYGPPAEQHCACIVSITIDHVDSGEIGYILENNYSILCRTGLHCAPLAHQAIGSFPAGTIRFSPGPFSTTEDIDYLINALQEIITLVRR